MVYRKFVILGVAMLMAGFGWADNAYFVNDPMGINVSEVDFYDWQGALQASIYNPGGEDDFLVHVSINSPYVYWIEVNNYTMGGDVYVPVDTTSSKYGSFTIAINTVFESVSGAFVISLYHDKDDNHTYESADDAWQDSVWGYTY